MDTPEACRGVNELESHLAFAAVRGSDENDAGFLLFLGGPIGDHDRRSLFQVGRKTNQSAVSAHTKHLSGLSEGLALPVRSRD